MKIKKINQARGVGTGVGCQGGSEQRIEVFVKIQKNRGRGWGGVGGSGRLGTSGWM